MTSRHPTEDPPERPVGTAAFSKFIHLLQLVSEGEKPYSIAELTRLSGYPQATVYRMVAGLVTEHLLVKSVSGKTYMLGPRLIELASRSWGRSELRLAAVDELKALRDATEEAVHLAVPNGLSMVYIEKLESLRAVRMASRIGTSVSLHSSSVGKAYLAKLGEAEREAILSRLEFPCYTPNTVASAAALRDQLGLIHSRGWSEDNEENEEGIFCFGAAIVDGKGKPVAAISVSTLRFRQKPDPIRAYVEPLLAAVQAISRRIAYVPVVD